MDKQILDSEPKPQGFMSSIKFKYILIIFLVGWIVMQIGAMAKLLSHPYADLLLTAAMIIRVFSGFLGVLKLWSFQDVHSFLNK